MRGLSGRHAAVAVMLFTVVATVVAPLPVTAQTGEAEPAGAPEFAIFPVGSHAHPWFDVTIDAGSTLDLIAGVKLSSDVPVELRAYAANAVNPPNGGFSAMGEDDEPVGATQWLGFPAQWLELAPGEERNVPLSVTVPAGTPPGEYVTSLVVQTAGALEIPGTDAFRQVVRSSVSVEITVPGEMTAGFELGEPVVTQGASQWVLDVPITNTGTARVRPAGELVVVDMKGAVVSSARVEMGSVYGGNSTVVRVPLPAGMSPGAYVVSMDLTDEATGASDTLVGTAITIAAREEASGISVEAVVTPHGDPIGYADLAVTVGNDGPAVPRARVTLVAIRDGDEVETYQLADEGPLSPGETSLHDRYIPPDGWTAGTWTFRIEVVGVDDRTERTLAVFNVGGKIAVL